MRHSSNPHRQFCFEAIEPRLLLSASAAITAVVSPTVQSGTIIVASDDGEGDAPAAKPLITPPTNLSVAEGARLRYLVLATGNPAPSIHLISGPAGLILHKGVLIWSVPAGQRIGTYHVTVVAKNALGKKRATFSISVTTDLTPPTAPFLSVGTAPATNAIPLTWTASTDNVGVVGYRVYVYTPAVYRGHSGRDGGITLVSPAKYTLLADHLTSTSYTVTGLAPGTSQQYVVTAYDAAGNQAASNIVTGSTPAAA